MSALVSARLLHNPFFSDFQSEEVVNLIIPGLDRGIYRWDGRKLSQFPFTADDLIDNAHLHRTHGSFLAGAKANDVVGLDINTGKVGGTLSLYYIDECSACNDRKPVDMQFSYSCNRT